MENKTLIIIKKKKKGDAGGHHGGSWKVAYADFVTAMMAFFLLMWLLNSSSQQQKEQLAYYFTNFNVFDKGSGVASGTSVGKEMASAVLAPAVVPALNGRQESEEAAAVEDLRKQLEADVENKLADVREQVVVGTFVGGVKVDIMDNSDSPMFPRGGTKLTESGKRILAVIAENLKPKKNLLEIEGHTDAVGYTNDREFSNWELSTSRASSARLELENQGVDPSRLIRVSGYAATEPIIQNDPYDPRNRRISLRLYP